MRIPHSLRAAAGAGAGGGDPNFASVSLLLHCDGSDGSTTFTDSSSNAFTVTANGNAKVDTTIKKFGTGSLELDGTGDYLSVASNAAFGFGTGDWTIEFWLYLNSTASQILVDCRTTDTDARPCIYLFSGTLTYIVNGASYSGSALSTSTWYHIAVARSGSSTKMFLDGVQDGSTITDNTNYLQSAVRIGELFGGGGAAVNGYFDDLRITKGVARYTANFTPPIAAFPDS